MPVMKNYRAEFPLEYCASRFLVQWTRYEQRLHEAVSSNPSSDAIKKALAYFQVSRSFGGLKDEPERLNLIYQSLMAVRNCSNHSPAGKVETLAKNLESHFNKFTLSAATKLLWLSYREPYVVYDRRAVTALSKKFKLKFPVRDYTEYSSAWRRQYSAVEDDIAAAVSRLPTGRSFMPRCSLDDKAMVALASQSWFKERVFDIFLWEVGGDG